MKYKHVSVAVFLIIYGLLTVPWLLWPLNDIAVGVIMFAPYLLLAVGLSADTTELILAFCWPTRSLPRNSGTAPRKLSAVVMVVCDDASREAFEYLVPIVDAGYDVYLLDDSRTAVALPTKLLGRVTQVRRPSRVGAKAGNLNNWLTRYGDRYEYALLLDSDSQISVESADTVLLTAEHSANADVAILQAKISSMPNKRSLLAQALSAGARPRMRVIERVHGPLGLLLSFGHNQLLRLKPIRDLYGFDEELTSEDTVLSLNLAAAGWRIELVDAWSIDTDPETASGYIRRTLRWARQTVELFHRPWYFTPLRLKLLICRHALAYASPILGIFLLGISMSSAPKTAGKTLAFLAASLSFTAGYCVYGTTLWSIFAVFGTFIILRTVMARQEGVPWRIILISFAVGSAPLAVMLLPLAGSMLASALGFRVGFVPTNSRLARTRKKEIAWRCLCALMTTILLGSLVLAAFYRPGGLVIGLNVIWLGQLLLSPLSLLVVAIHRRHAISRIHSDYEDAI